MLINAIEGVVENGRIRLREDVSLPENTRVYVIVAESTGADRAASPLRGWPIRNSPATSANRLWRRPAMPSYDAFHDPPAPVARVTLRDGGKVVPDVPLLIDSGADVTLLPRTAVESLGIRPVGGPAYELVGFDGTRSSARLWTSI